MTAVAYTAIFRFLVKQDRHMMMGGLKPASV